MPPTFHSTFSARMLKSVGIGIHRSTADCPNSRVQQVEVAGSRLCATFRPFLNWNHASILCPCVLKKKKEMLNLFSLYHILQSWTRQIKSLPCHHPNSCFGPVINRDPRIERHANRTVHPKPRSPPTNAGLLCSCSHSRKTPPGQPWMLLQALGYQHLLVKGPGIPEICGGRDELPGFRPSERRRRRWTGRWSQTGDK